ncbi:Sulfite exporter TauE/SafE [Methylobrevis pamukkalensis]|uniref:Probable membrane transporter protein n=1 Tax=Methylobrevis pamukkalensis TaxID=1439726 RepID=A0A1E3H1Q9_9HYPH|nr:Sulfite exporter TauE/SafE [Methylobrevis pamukkalensis]
MIPAAGTHCRYQVAGSAAADPVPTPDCPRPVIRAAPAALQPTGPRLEFLASINPLYSLSGLAVGILVGLTGVGGGSLMTPLLVLVFGVHPVTAVGTDLLYASITKAGGTAIHGLNKTIDWVVMGLLALGSVPATVVTLLVLSQVDGARSPAAAHFITTALGGA